MRRFVAIALASAFLFLQMSAGAPAAQTSGPHIVPLRAEFAANLANIEVAFQAAVQRSYVLALVTDSTTRYNAIHATAPVFKANPPQLLTPSQERISRGVPGTSRGSGISVPVPKVPLPASGSVSKDRLAMRADIAEPSPHATLAKNSATATSKDVAVLSAQKQLRTMGAALIVPTITGINPYWRYETGSIPGAGRWMVNMGSNAGNLIVQGDDADVHERAIDLAFRRTYNSQSLYDVSGDDGSGQSNYGNGWTNNLDAHMAYDPGSNRLVVYDGDGAAYAYTADGNGNWVPPPGSHNKLTASGSCYYDWTKKSGITYSFFSPLQDQSGCGLGSGYNGRLAQIFARNSYTTVRPTYYWLNGDASSLGNLTKIVVYHSDNQFQTLTLNFSLFNGHDLLASLIRPDGASVTYDYDQYGNLTDVYDIGNNAASNATPLHHRYGYNTPDSGAPNPDNRMAFADSPDWVASRYSAGSYLFFYYDYNTTPSGAVQEIQYNGTVNPTPTDGTGTPLQSGYATGVTAYYTDFFSFEEPGESGYTDTDGHSATFSLDQASARVTDASIWTGSRWLVTSYVWDADDNLISTIDPRSFETDYAYDLNGNTVAIALPPPVAGGSRPTSLYSYDSYNNVIAYCDPVRTQQLGEDWDQTGRPAANDALCPSQPGAIRYTWHTGTAPNVYGYLTDTYTAAYGLGNAQDPGYHTSITYDSFSQPTAATGDQISQEDGSVVTPTQQFAYDSYGNLACYSNNQEGGSPHWWRLTYDSLNRNVAVADPDDASLYGQCQSAPGLPSSHVASDTTYYANGQIASTQSPSEYAEGVSASYTYDADGSELSETHHYGNVAGVTQKWYDGDDRLVEVEEPTDNGNVPAYYQTGNPDLWPNITRYLYDLTKNQQVSIAGGPSYYAHGNLFKVQRWLPGKYVVVDSTGNVAPAQAEVKPSVGAGPKAANTPKPVLEGTPPPGSSRLPSSFRATVLRPRAGRLVSSEKTGTAMSLDDSVAGQWLDVSGTAFDPLDRTAATYAYEPGTDTVTTHSYVYDTGSAAGLLVSETTPVGDEKSYAYDDIGRTTGIAFSVSSASTYTPSRTYTFDEDSRVASVGNQEFGTWTFTYSADGNLTSETEPAGGGSGIPGVPYANSGVMTSAAAFQQAFYGNGWESLLQTQAGASSYTQEASYRSDGLDKTDYYSTVPGSITRQYTAGGRVLQRVDPTGTDSTSYDTYGREHLASVPSGTFTYSAYDAEGELTGSTVSPTNGTPVTDDPYYTVTGQMASGKGAYGYNTVPSYFLDTAKILFDSESNDDLVHGCGYSTSTLVDTRNQLVIGTEVSNGGGVIYTDSYSYDAGGRITQITHPFDAGSCSVASAVLNGYGYDAENHTTSTFDGTNSNMHYYSWGPIGHPVTVGECRVTYNPAPTCTSAQNGPWLYSALHWSGNQLLFTTRADGALTDYKLGADGDVLPTDVCAAGTSYYDRDASGQIIFSHNANGHTGSRGQYVGSYDGCSQILDGGTEAPPSYYGENSGPTFSYQRVDAVTDGSSILQGVRSYNPASQQWTTPDAFAGDVDDPMSQSKYMWNNNNAVAYSDPSGYCPGVSSQGSGQEAVVQVCGFIPGKTNGTPYPALKGDNRKFEKTSKGQTDDSRVVITIDFGRHRVTHTIGSSHTLSGASAGKGHLLDFSVKWDGAHSVTVTMRASCGVCPSGVLGNLTPHISFSGSFRLNANGTISGKSSFSQYPAFEGYEYGGANETLFQHMPNTSNGAVGLSEPLPVTESY